MIESGGCLVVCLCVPSSTHADDWGVWGAIVRTAWAGCQHDRIRRLLDLIQRHDQDVPLPQRMVGDIGLHTTIAFDDSHPAVPHRCTERPPHQEGVSETNSSAPHEGPSSTEPNEQNDYAGLVTPRSGGQSLW